MVVFRVASANQEQSLTSFHSQSPRDKDQFNASVDNLYEADLLPLETPQQTFQFQGLSFDFGISRTLPIEIVRGNMTTGLYTKNLFDFLYEMQLNGMFERKANPGTILFADDQYVNQQAFRMNLKELGFEKQLITHYDGEGVVEFFDFILDDIDDTYID